MIQRGFHDEKWGGSVISAHKNASANAESINDVLPNERMIYRTNEILNLNEQTAPAISVLQTRLDLPSLPLQLMH